MDPPLRLREDWWVFEKSLIKVNGKTGGLSKKIEMLVVFRKNQKKNILRLIKDRWSFEKQKRVCHKSVTHPFFVFFLFTDTKSLKNIFIYNKAQTFTSSGFAFPQKICIFAENFLKYGKDTNKI